VKRLVLEYLPIRQWSGPKNNLRQGH